MSDAPLEHRFNLMMSSKQLDALRAVSAETGAPIAELIRRAIEKVYPFPMGEL